MQIQDYITLEQTKALYRDIKILLIGMVGVSLVTVLVFWSVSSKTSLLIWLAAAALIVVVRAFTFRQFHQSPLRLDKCRMWLSLSMFGSFITGAHWGFVPVYFLTSDAIVYALFVSIVFTGHMAGAITINSSYSPGFLALAIPTSTMFAGKFFYEGGSTYNTMGVMVVFYVALCFVMSRNAQRMFVEVRELNYKNMRLMEQLVAEKENAEQATVAKDRFLAAASHDLRQPLHSSGLLLSALDQYISAPEGKELLADIQSSNEALNHSFNSLLDVSRLDAGVIDIRLQHINLKSALAQTLKSGEAEAKQKGVKFVASDDDIAVHTDPVLLERILHNLISNAINYTQAGSIEVHWSECTNNRVRILVSDTGIGIEAGQLNDVFSEYYQINNPERDRDKGFGLGLAIVTRLCAILNIQLHVCSQPDRGTVFGLYLPQASIDKVVVNMSNAKPITNLSGVNVLVIDDDRSVLKSMHKLLASWGCNVYCEESEEAALELVIALEETPDILIADYRLRGNRTGVQAIERILDELNVAIPAMIVTGDTSPDRLKDLTKSGLPVLHKPVSAAVLRSAVQRYLKSSYH